LPDVFMNNIKVTRHQGDHGTGSYPLPPQGWQRAILFIASHEPLKSPYFLSASNAYWLQVGWQRQAAGNIGDIAPW